MISLPCHTLTVIVCTPASPSVPLRLSQCAYLLIHLSHFDCLRVHTCWSIFPLYLIVHTFWSICPTLTVLVCIPVCPSIPLRLSQSAYLLFHLSHFDADCIPVGPSIPLCLRVHTCWSICPSLTVSECIPVVPSAHFVSVYVPVGPSIPLCLRVHTCWSIYFTLSVSECIPVGPYIPL